jgi:hypothetical protein
VREAGREALFTEVMPVAELKQREGAIGGKNAFSEGNSDGLRLGDLKPALQRAQGGLPNRTLTRKPRTWPARDSLQLVGFGLLVLSELLLAAGRSGRDLNKHGQPLR